MKLYTTLNKIRAHNPCEDSWKTLLKSLGKTKPDDKKLALATILKHLNLDDALWALWAVDGHEKEMRLFACDCAKRVLPIFEKQYPDDKRSREAIEVSRRFAFGKATEEELAAARAAAAGAAWAAAWAAAAGAAAGAAWAAAGAAAGAAWAAAGAAAGAAWAAERKAQTRLFRKYFC